jgi:DNA-binding response OmpR family regulator
MHVVLVSNDLMVVSRVQGAAAKAGSTIYVASNVAAAQDFLSREASDVVIADLAAPLAELEAFVAELKSEPDNAPRILAFGPHVHEDRLAAARAAGCDVVMSRGQFFAQVEAILAH